MADHFSLDDLRSLHAEGNRLFREKHFREAARAFGDVLVACPTFVPSLLMRAAALQLDDSPDISAEGGLDSARNLLKRAVDASGRGAPALVDLAHFVYAIEDNSVEAEPLFHEGVSAALGVLEDGWTGLLGALCEQGKFRDAKRIATLAATVFPKSCEIQEAVEEVERGLRENGGDE